MNATDRVLQRCAVVAIYVRQNAKFAWTTPFVPVTGVSQSPASVTVLQIPARFSSAFEHFGDPKNLVFSLPEDLRFAELGDYSIHRIDGLC